MQGNSSANLSYSQRKCLNFLVTRQASCLVSTRYVDQRFTLDLDPAFWYRTEMEYLGDWQSQEGPIWRGEIVMACK